MAFLTDEKLVIVGAGGAIGSTMVQTALTMKLRMYVFTTFTLPEWKA